MPLDDSTPGSDTDAAPGDSVDTRGDVDEDVGPEVDADTARDSGDGLAPDATQPGDAEVEVQDPDRDSDGVLNDADACPDGATGWTSSAESDHDGDGCRDLDEDDDDDNDGVPDGADACPLGVATGPDLDDDGCKDTEDDSDGDGFLDAEDKCPIGTVGWVATYAEDIDGDGCRDSDQDDDDDGDGVLDAVDPYPAIWGPFGEQYACDKWAVPPYPGWARFEIPEIVQHQPAEIRQLSPATTPVLGSWVPRTFFFHNAYETSGMDVAAQVSPNGTFRFTSDTVGEFRLSILVKPDPESSAQFCIGTVFNVRPPNDVIYVQVVKRAADGERCGYGRGSFNNTLPGWVDPAVFAPDIRVGIEKDMIFDADGDGGLDPWETPGIECSMFSCPDSAAFCRSEKACSHLAWVAGEPSKNPRYTKETGFGTFALSVPPPTASSTLRIAIHDKSIPIRIDPDKPAQDGAEFFIHGDENLCPLAQVRVWAYGRLVEDRTQRLGGTFWDVGDVDVATGNFTRRGKCTNVTPTRFCRVDADCGEGITCGNNTRVMAKSRSPYALHPEP